MLPKRVRESARDIDREMGWTLRYWEVHDAGLRYFFGSYWRALLFCLSRN
jgi:hypothetical protein